jgi:hypothetical protein
MDSMKKPRKTGAPHKPADKAKAELIQLRVNVAEKKAFADAATLDGKKLSEWMRDRLRRLARVELEAQGLPVAFLASQPPAS